MRISVETRELKAWLIPFPPEKYGKSELKRRAFKCFNFSSIYCADEANRGTVPWYKSPITLQHNRSRHCGTYATQKNQKLKIQHQKPKKSSFLR